MEKEILKGKPVRDAKEVTSRYKMFQVLFIVSSILVLCGILMGVITNLKRYESERRPVKADIVVDSVTEQDDSMESGSGMVTSHMYHLSTTYSNGGSDVQIVLDESYPEEEMALKYVGTARQIYIDIDKNVETQMKPFNMTFIAILFVNLSIMVVSTLALYRYRLEYRLVQPQKRSSKSSTHNE